MTDYFVDPNRGDDSKNGIGQANAVKTLARISAINPNPGGGGGIYLASDGIHRVTANRTSIATSRCGIYIFNGASATSRAFLGSYDPVGGSSQKAQVIASWNPAPGDWTWDSSLHNGAPRGWYIAYTYSTVGWNMAVKVANSVYAVTTNQGYGTGRNINTTTNGMTADTLRFDADSTTSGAHRLYLAGGGLTQLVDPTTYFGSVEIGNTGFMIFDCGQYTVVENLSFSGGKLLDYQLAGVDRQVLGVTARNITSNWSAGVITLGSTATGTPLMDVDIYNNDFRNLAGPGVDAYGKGIAGRIHHNNVVTGNLASSQGGSFYVSADSLSRSIDIEYNTGDDIRSGVGNNTYDGCFCYTEYQSTNVRMRWNFCKNSHKAYQINNGKYCELIGNVAWNCDVLATCSDEGNLNTSDYRVMNNTYVGTDGMNKYPMGVDSATWSTSPLSLSANGGDLTGVTVMNNAFIGTGVSSRPVMRVLTSALYPTKATVNKNFAVGYSAQVIQDWNSVDRTSGSNTITAGDPKFKNASNGDVRVLGGSALIGAGAANALVTADARGKWYSAAPAIGAYEEDKYVSVDAMII